MERLACVLIAVWAMSTADARAQTNAVPPAKPPAGRVVVDGLHQAAETTLGTADMAIEAGKALGGEIDKAAEQFVDEAGKATEAAGHVIGAYDAYRDQGAEGMVVYGAQELGERALDTVAERLAGPAAPAWRFGRAIGDAIKENVKIKGQTIESHVTNLYFNNLHGRRANEEFERNTSDDAIERQRQKMHRAGIFASVQNANEQAAANRAAVAQASAASDNAAFMNEMMLTIMPVATAASHQRTIQPPLPAPQVSTTSSPLPPLEWQTRCLSDGITLAGQRGRTHCYQEPVYPGHTPRNDVPPPGATIDSRTFP